MLATRAIASLRRKYYSIICKASPYKKQRWVLTLILAVIYI